MLTTTLERNLVLLSKVENVHHPQSMNYNSGSRNEENCHRGYKETCIRIVTLALFIQIVYTIVHLKSLNLEFPIELDKIH